MIDARVTPQRSASVVAFFAIVLVTQACGWNEGVVLPPVSDPPASFADGTTPSPPILDLSGKKALTVFWLLGFLDEYLGRPAIDDGDVVERLYCNEHDKLKQFRTMLRRLLSEQRMTDDLREDLLQECLPFLRSAELTRGLNSMYVSREVPGMFDPSDGRRRPITVLKATHAMFERAGSNERLAYLAGAYYRYGQDGVFSFANSAHKADLIAQLLGEVGIESIERQTFTGIPNGNVVRFAGPEKLQALFARVMR